jgi:hypothetical protein
MIATTLLRRLAETLRHRSRWLAPVALVALAPKCLLCVAAYAGLGAALGLGGREMCGATAGPPGTWVSPLGFLGVALVVFGVLAGRRCRRNSG